MKPTRKEWTAVAHKDFAEIHCYSCKKAILKDDPIIVIEMSGPLGVACLTRHADCPDPYKA